MPSFGLGFFSNMFGSSNEEEEEEEQTVAESEPAPKSSLKRRSNRRASVQPNLTSGWPSNLQQENKSKSRAAAKHTKVKRRPRSMGDALDQANVVLKPIQHASNSGRSRKSKRQSTMPKVSEEEEVDDEEHDDKENEEKSDKKKCKGNNKTSRHQKYKVDQVNLKELKIVVKREPIKVLQDKITDDLTPKKKGSSRSKKALQSDVEDEILASGGKSTPATRRAPNKRTRRASNIKKRYLETESEEEDNFEVLVKGKRGSSKKNNSKKLKSSSSDESGSEYKPGEDSFRDEILDNDDKDDDDSDTDSFIAGPDESPNKVFTFYSKTELRRSKVKADMTIITPPKKSTRSRRASTNFSPLVKGKKSELKTSSRRLSMMVVKKETPKRAKKLPTPSASRGRVASKKRLITGEAERVKSARRSLGLNLLGDGHKLGTPMQEAQARLHVAAVPDALPCREDKFAEIYAFVESKVREREGGGCIYVSGVPGTGKTATVKEVIRRLQEEVSEGDLEDFTFVEINGMRLTEPSQAYSVLWKELTGQKVTCAHARDLLEERFTSNRGSEATVLLVDELDKLWNRKQSVLYNLFDWPTLGGSRLVVVAIANTMDLPEKMLMNRVASRLGLTRCQFPPYTHAQLSEIVTSRLSGMSEQVFDADAVQLVARKVASLSGDARRALDICRRATEIAEREMDKKGEKSALVGIEHVVRAHEEMFQSLRVTAVRCCSEYERLFLRAVVYCFHRTGFEETTLDRVHRCLNEQLVVTRRKAVSTSEAYDICMGLAACRLVLAESGRHGPRMRIWLNVSTDDVTFALDSVDRERENDKRNKNGKKNNR